MMPRYDIAWHDLRTGVANWQMWGRLGWSEVKRRYRRTAIGPFWTTLSLAVFVVTLGIVWSTLWKMNIAEYLPFLCAGLVVWSFVSQAITESCNVFIAQEALIKQMKFPYSLLTCSVMWRNLVVFFHNLIVFVFVAIICGVPINFATALALPGLVIVTLNGLWVSILLGLACARFRDIQQLMAGLLQIAMFVTPIFWSSTQLSGQMSTFVDFNILYHMIDIVRSPLLGRLPTAWSWQMVMLTTVAGWSLTFFVFSRFRHRLPYWL